LAASRDGVTGIYRQPISGGTPERLVTLEANDVYDFAYAPKGDQLAVTRSDYQFDVVLLRFEPQ
jgi:Tol biopolymer transport system component